MQKCIGMAKENSKSLGMSIFMYLLYGDSLKETKACPPQMIKIHKLFILNECPSRKPNRVNFKVKKQDEELRPYM